MMTNNKLILLFALTLVYIEVVAAQESPHLRWWSLLASSSGSSEETETTKDSPFSGSAGTNSNHFQDFAATKDDFSTTVDKSTSKTGVTWPTRGDVVGDTMIKHDGYKNDARKLKKSKKGVRVPTPPRAPTAPIPPTTFAPIVFIWPSKSSKSSKSSKKRDRKLNWHS